MAAEDGETNSAVNRVGNGNVGVVGVVGASVRAVVGSLLRAQQPVVAADLFADADLISCCEVTRIDAYPEGFEAWLAATPCAGWIYTGALENYPDLIDRLAAIRPLLGHTGDVLRRVRDPLALQAAHLQAGLDFPETVLTSKQKNTAGDWLSKTYRGSSGSGVQKSGGKSDDGADRPTYLQRYVPGISLSAVFHGDKLLGITRQLVGETWARAAPFQYCGSIGPWKLSANCSQKLQRLGEMLCKEFGLTSLYGVDLIYEELIQDKLAHDKANERLWTIEVNPRYTAAVEVVERAYGICVFEESSVPHAIDEACGKVVLFAKTELPITAEVHLAMMQARGGTWPGVADIPAVGTVIGTGEPVCTLLDTGATADAVYAQLLRRSRALEKQFTFAIMR